MNDDRSSRGPGQRGRGASRADGREAKHLWVVNCGSATLKHELFSVAPGGRLASIDRQVVDADAPLGVLVAHARARLGARPDAIVHRLVLGGPRLSDPVLVDDAVLDELRRVSSLAPLHNPPAVAGIEATWGLGVPLVAVFDSAFHASLPPRAHRYALPEGLSPPEWPLRRWGFHGWSHRWVTERFAALTGEAAPTLVSLHLGSGCSAAAILAGRSVDTSMGLTPLEGLVMGTRAGDLDPGLILHLVRGGLAPARLEEILNREAGLRGLAGTSDMRALLARDDEAARAAIEIFCYRALKYAGAYLAALGGARAIVFTGGIGERAPEIRRRIAEGLAFAGLALDHARNEHTVEGRLSVEGARLEAWVIPAREERLIAQEAARLLHW